jgi:hypothetical protein
METAYEMNPWPAAAGIRKETVMSPRLHPHPAHPAHPAYPTLVHPAPRSGAAALLRAASRLLGRAARRLEAQAWQRRRGQAAFVAVAEPLLEFHAEAGAMEGALFVNGQLVGQLPIARL